MKMSEIATAVMDPFWATAEISYRQERARDSYHRRSFDKPRRPRRWLPRRPTLKLPQQRRRPVAVA